MTFRYSRKLLPLVALSVFALLFSSCARPLDVRPETDPGNAQSYEDVSEKPTSFEESVKASESASIEKSLEDLTSTTESESETTPSESETEPPTTTEYVEPRTISLVMVGDMLMHAGVSIRGTDYGNNTVNYDYLFENTRGAIQAADIAVVNNEVVMGGDDKGFIGIVGYPCFNISTALGEAEVRAGFDVVLNATNHVMDQETSGIRHCMNYWDTRHPDMTYLGIHKDQNDANSVKIVERNGIKVAMLNYTYGLNGFKIPGDQSYLVDLLTEENKPKIAMDLYRARTLADFVVVFPHWGEEFQLRHNENQEDWAKFFISNGADLIIGTHPHCLQDVAKVTANNGRTGICYYSIGNYVSQQFLTYTMLGGMPKVSITKDSSGTYVSDYRMDFLVTHYNINFSYTGVFYLRDYTDALASDHGIEFSDAEAAEQEALYGGSMARRIESRNENRATYPWSVGTLWGLVRKICPNMLDE